MKNLSFTITKEVSDLGVRVVTARIKGLQNSSSNLEFETFKQATLEKLKQELTGKPYKDDPILVGFRDLHAKVGRSNRDYVASPEMLRWLLLERGRFPHINTVVDIYNLISLEMGLALGAHDVEKIQGNVTLSLTNGNETFIPLGKSEPLPIFPGEYCYVDDVRNVICRLEVLQCDSTKVTDKTKDIFLIVEGNENTDLEYIRQAAEKVCELIVRYCGGAYSLI